MGVIGGVFDSAAYRNKGVLHRSAITAVDKLAAPGALTVAAVTESGSTLPASALFVAVVSGNRWGPTTATISSSTTPSANQALRVTPASLDANADYHDIFISVDTAPKWVGRATAAQFTAGGFIISTVGSVTAGGGAGAGAIDLGIVGTGQQTSATNFAQNNAYTPGTVTLIDCSGKSRAHILVKLALTDLRSAPALSVIPYLANQVSAADWHAGALKALSILGALGQPLEQDYEVDVDGSTGLVVLVDAISGQGAAASIWVELA